VSVGDPGQPLLHVVFPRWPGLGLHNVLGHRFPPQALYVLGALARRQGWAVRLVDENYEPIPDERPDLVAITVWTVNAVRAFDLGDAYRQRGIPVVMGGVHASLLPGEALGHADAVVAGEAEGIFATVLADAAAGRLRPLYHGSWDDMAGVPGIEEHISLMRAQPLGRYFPSQAMQTTRGCRFNCDFCSVIRINGRGSRHLETERVVEELRFRRRIPPRAPVTFVFFSDDDLASDPEYAAELFEALIAADTGVHWGVQASIGLARNPELLDLARRAGCRMLFSGFESLSRASLVEANKKNRPSEYAELVARIHAQGIVIEGGFIVGFDADGPDVFAQTAAGADAIDVDSAHFTILTPYPGTTTFARMVTDDRLVDLDWSRFDNYHAVYEPARMSRADLEAGVLEAYRLFYGRSSRARRLRRRLALGKPWPLVLCTGFNVGYARVHAAATPPVGGPRYAPPPAEVEALLATSSVDAPHAVTTAVQSYAARAGLAIVGDVGPAPGARAGVPVSLAARPPVPPATVAG
jgi:radical SAM superfamily enzyme YgiQ (UPF0313 family)